jgi:hypothetical protein
VLTLIGLFYFAGWLGSVVVQRQRAGLSQRGRISLETALTSLPWFATSCAKMVAWPVVLGVWLYQDKPESPWHAVTSANGGSLRVQRVTAISPGK